jgi:long-chain-fatty-acid--[acyl-carrier-protein] ligase
MEDLRAGIGKLELLLTILRVRWMPRTLHAAVARVSADEPAVVLFTSGSEKAPKAVPLTHRNILSNVRGVLDVIGVSRRDVILGFLPVFHSFGVIVTGVLPILSGMRVVYHPDPTDAGALLRKIVSYRPTILCGTPTFVAHIAGRARPEDLASLRIIVLGSEKCPPDLFARLASLAPAAAVLEGYGITECSPIVACNRIGNTRPGSLGLPIPGVEVRIVDPETYTSRPAGQMGLLLVHGPNVFGGYIGFDGPPPFREMDGRRWYITGDLARIDEAGFIHFCGREKRFIKAGGEMISLPALEEPFASKFPPTDSGPRVAVEGIEIDGGGRRIVLFTTEPISLKEANETLAAAGQRGVMRIDEVRRVSDIPTLGTGKTDYKVLRRRITVTTSSGRR